MLSRAKKLLGRGADGSAEPAPEPLRRRSRNPRILALKAMTPEARAASRESALAARLRTFAETVTGDTSPDGLGLPEALESAIAALTKRGGEGDVLWLAHIAFLAKYPTHPDLERLASNFALAGPREFAAELITENAKMPDKWPQHVGLEIVTQPVVDVTHTAGFGKHTGIQRVVRETVPRWNRDHLLQLAMFDKQTAVLRRLGEREVARVLDWGNHVDPSTNQPDDAPLDVILVPWHTTVIVPEVSAFAQRSLCLTALARWSGCQTASICFDLIPYSMPEVVDEGTRVIYSDFMAFQRCTDRVSTISESVGEDLAGLRVSYRNMGIPGPQIKAQVLPVYVGDVSEETIERVKPSISAGSGPVVLSVSTIEPRKNHVTTLRAAERLWREGLEFQLVYIAGAGWKKEVFESELKVAEDRRRPVRVIRGGVTDEMLWSAYRIARFTVFVSLTEGYGLPAAESIAAGTPVVLSRIGSMIEVGDAGGAEFVDPNDLDDVTAAMRRLLTDDTRLDVLRKEAAGRSMGTWDDYAAATWDWFVNGTTAS